MNDVISVGGARDDAAFAKFREVCDKYKDFEVKTRGAVNDGVELIVNYQNNRSFSWSCTTYSIEESSFDMFSFNINDEKISWCVHGFSVSNFYGNRFLWKNSELL